MKSTAAHSPVPGPALCCLPPLVPAQRQGLFFCLQACLGPLFLRFLTCLRPRAGALPRGPAGPHPACPACPARLRLPRPRPSSSSSISAEPGRWAAAGHLEMASWPCSLPMPHRSSQSRARPWERLFCCPRTPGCQANSLLAEHALPWRFRAGASAHGACLRFQTWLVAMQLSPCEEELPSGSTGGAEPGGNGRWKATITGPRKSGPGQGGFAVGAADSPGHTGSRESLAPSGTDAAWPVLVWACQLRHTLPVSASLRQGPPALPGQRAQQQARTACSWSNTEGLAGWPPAARPLQGQNTHPFC